MKKIEKMTRVSTSTLNQNKRVLATALVVLSSSVLIPEICFADPGTVADAATNLSPLFNKIIGSLSGTLGKVIMAVSLLMSGIAAVAGMNKAVILTPIGVGMLLGNASTLINWMF